MVCPLFLSVKLQGLNTNITPLALVSESQCIRSECGFWNDEFVCCGQSAPQTYSLEGISRTLVQISRDGLPPSR